ncbi:hypothetical protein BDW60DRAFT_195653 [Aspergillus nidulans var. acristatus]
MAQDVSQSPFMEALPPHLKTRVRALQSIQQDKTVLDAKLQREIRALEKTYWVNYAPLFQRRFDIITGHLDPSQDRSGKVNGPPGIPDFWLTAMNNHPDISMRIEEADEPVLKFLTDIRVEYGEDFDFSLVFHFAPNEYFSNLMLRVKFFYQKNFTGEWPDPLKVVGDRIDWRPGKRLAGLQGGMYLTMSAFFILILYLLTVLYVDQNNEDEDKIGSFFDLFSPPTIKSGANEEEKEEFEFLLEAEFVFAEELKDELIPRAVDWYTGDAVSDDGDEDEDEDEEDNDEDSDEGSDEGSDEDSNEDDSDEEESDDDRRPSQQKAPRSYC